MSNFFEIINQQVPTLVDFHATWCGPCKMQSPILDEVKSKIGDAGTIVKIDVDRNQELAAQYRVQSVPTLMMFCGGNMVWRASGVQSAEVLVAKFAEFSQKEK